ncbi:MAG: glycosyltransferase family 1 protein [Deltaproteobacteria bacterium]|nr:glycosyltransferase family 1 protein [Deltaproteobacteria bacterium]
MTDSDFQKKFAKLPERLKGLETLAGNLWWSWHTEARMLFKNIDRQLWKENRHNPVKMLGEVSAELLEKAAGNPEYLRHYDLVMSKFRRYMEERKCLFMNGGSHSNIKAVAYFSAEYGLHHSLPLYAGGLGFLAGDFLKECSDLHLPLVAVGFMYPKGYVRQRIRADGWQESMEAPLDRDAATISRVTDEKGNQVVVQVPLMDPPLYLTAWRIDIGRITLYLLDTDIEENDPWNRGISSHLYAGDREQRLRQEIVLGIGGSKLLDTLGIVHFVTHLNEGHPAFALLERILRRMEDGLGYDEALEKVRQTSVFTTHTPVPAGHDVFSYELIEKYLAPYWKAFGITREEFFNLGLHPEEPQAGFNMTAFALRLCEYRNGVSKKHGEVARRMWKSLWPDLAEEEIPIDYVTNGVHVPFWVEPKMALLFNRYLGPNWLNEQDDPSVWELVEDIPDDELWRTHFWMKLKLIHFIREKTRQRWIQECSTQYCPIAFGGLLDPTVLTIGFARRFATYKRADLILQDLERLKKLVGNRWRPIQVIFAGKAHPADDPGKSILQRIYNFARDPEMAGRIAFVEDYDEQLGQYMVHGVDVWLNNPIPPLEASGTSGMKAALNGVPQCSVADGWWLEGYNGSNGWSFGERDVSGNRNAADAAELYDLLEKEIIPRYYDASSRGIPTAWVRIMKNTIKSAGARFSARRMVKEYIDKFYTRALNGNLKGTKLNDG